MLCNSSYLYRVYALCIYSIYSIYSMYFIIMPYAYVRTRALCRTKAVSAGTTALTLSFRLRRTSRRLDRQSRDGR